MFTLKFLIPEIFLSISIFSLLMIGVFIKNSFEIIYRLSLVVIFAIILIILTGDNDNTKIFSESFTAYSFVILFWVGRVISLSVKLKNSYRGDNPFVAESGIKSQEDLDYLMKNGINNFLIGESLMRKNLQIWALVEVITLAVMLMNFFV